MTDVQLRVSPREKVLFVASWYPTTEHLSNGVFVREHARAVSLFHDVHVLHLAPENLELPTHYRHERNLDSSVTAGLRTSRVTYRRHASRTRPATRMWAAMKAAGEVASWGFEPTLIHANVHETALASLLIGTRYRCRVVLSEHSSQFPRGLLTRGQALRARWTFPRMAAVMPVSRQLSEDIRRCGIDARFRVVPNAVDPNVFFPSAVHPRSDHGTRFLFVGNHKPVKGLSRLFQVLDGLRKDGQTRWTLTLIGDGEERSQLERLAMNLDLHDVVTFLGVLPKQEVAEHMRRHDVLLLPSEWENLPCVIIEAMATGMPVVASRVGGIPEIFDEGAEGLLVPPGDTLALRQALERVLNGHFFEFDRTEIARRARDIYGLRAVGARFSAVYQEVKRATS